MPTYSFMCDACENEFEVICRMSERENQTCPKCGSTHYHSHFTSPLPIGDPVRLGVRSMDGGFREVLSRIGRANPRSNLGSKLSRK